ncbi:hypothetical protein TALK_14775 [Thalassospira alkalitolerans]|uniref:Uncharacterized protein n=1 Tax=Thalassospira alkalitolerans TaxID=1293890 RepID=A0A1Y2L9M0_9PROT|nr:hypothetical protein TALK_14775 [Thalassospira alkalitolerans]
MIRGRCPAFGVKVIRGRTQTQQAGKSLAISGQPGRPALLPVWSIPGTALVPPNGAGRKSFIPNRSERLE